MRFPILDKYDNWDEIASKFNEEVKEFESEITNDNQRGITRELFDIMQVCIGGLDMLENQGVKLNPKLLEHYQKLLKRGWKIKGQVELDFINRRSDVNEKKTSYKR